MKTARYKISIKNVHDIRTLAYATTDQKINGIIESPNASVKTNSILGLFTLDLSEPHVLLVSAESNEDIAAFERSIKENNISLVEC